MLSVICMLCIPHSINVKIEEVYSAAAAQRIIDLLLMIRSDQTSARDKLQIRYCQIFH